MSEREAELTRFLVDLSHGAAGAEATLMPHIYSELRAIAASYAVPRAGAEVLPPTMLVNEAYLKLFGGAPIEWANRKHFYVVAAKAMRQLLIDHARNKRRLKRGGDERHVTFDEAALAASGVNVDMLELDHALRELTELDERQGRIVELRYFAGLEVAEVADVMEVSKTTVEREWRAARAWLGKRLAE